MKEKLSNLAYKILSMNGFTTTKDIDFQTTDHPRGIFAWNQAIIAWSIIKDDKSILKYQR